MHIQFYEIYIILTYTHINTVISYIYGKMVIRAFRQIGLEDFGESVEDELSSNYSITVCNYGSQTDSVSKLINYAVKVKWQFD